MRAAQCSQAVKNGIPKKLIKSYNCRIIDANKDVKIKRKRF